MRLFLNELDVFFLSYDEANAETNFSKLVAMAPWARRIQGIKGWDAVHKAAAFDSESEYFVTVDADTIPYAEFFDLELNITEELQGCALSWNSINRVNGLCYGNGGLKIWPKQKVLEMQTHEKATEKEHSVDFCWGDKYVQFQNIYSDTWPNGSPLQAWRAGFREGVKMTLDQGKKVYGERLISRIWPGNIRRLLVWCSVGSDVTFGEWSTLGAIEGFYLSACDYNFDHSVISDIDWLNNQFRTYDHTNQDSMIQEIKARTGIQIPVLDAVESKFIKDWILERPRQYPNPLVREKEVQ